MNAIKRFIWMILFGGGLLLSSLFINQAIAQDDFEEFETSEKAFEKSDMGPEKTIDPHLKTAVIVFIWTALDGLAVRYSANRPLRGISL